MCVPATFELCTEFVRPDGHIANISVHGKSATLHLESLWIRDITVTTGLVDAYSTPTLMRLIEAHQIDATRFATRHFKLTQMTEASDVFHNAGETGALKVVLTD
jgi:alcohol dehydrogenase